MLPSLSVLDLPEILSIPNLPQLSLSLIMFVKRAGKNV